MGILHSRLSIYIVAHYNLMHAAQKWQKTDQTWNSHKAPHNSLSLTSCGESFVRCLEKKWLQDIRSALYLETLSLYWNMAVPLPIQHPGQLPGVECDLWLADLHDAALPGRSPTLETRRLWCGCVARTLEILREPHWLELSICDRRTVCSREVFWGWQTKGEIWDQWLSAKLR